MSDCTHLHRWSSRRVHRHGPSQHSPPSSTDAIYDRFRRFGQPRSILSIALPHYRRIRNMRVSTLRATPLIRSIRAIFNLMSFQNGPQPMGNRGPPTRNMRIIEQIAWNEVSDSGRKVLNLQYFTVVACSIVFFFCFATSELAYWAWLILRSRDEEVLLAITVPCLSLPPREAEWAIHQAWFA